MTTASNDRRNIVIRGSAQDVYRFISHLRERKRKIRQGSKTPPKEGHVAEIASVLHPVAQYLQVKEVRDEGPKARTYVLVPASPEGAITPFRAGSYLVVDTEPDRGHAVGRPYSICNPPEAALASNTYEICVKSDEDAFVAARIAEGWRVGTRLTASDPRGEFTWEPLRDGRRLVFIGGGTGITPFRSLCGDILSGSTDSTIVLIHAARRASELYFDEDFRRWEESYSERFRRIILLSDDPGGHPSHRHGFVDASILSEALGGEDATLFVCGPPEMHRHIDHELKTLERRPRRLRREDYGRSGSPDGTAPHTIRVRDHSGTREIEADPGETVLVSMERAGLNPPSSCRNGSCGFCRSRLVEGEVDYDRNHEGLRRADRNLGYFHPCVAMPRSDMIVEIPVRRFERPNHPKQPEE